jgi:hypothetical protein
MDRYLDEVDEGMRGIQSWDLAADAGLESGDPRYERTNLIGRKALSGLYMTAMFADLSVEDQMHPGMQKRMVDALPRIGETADEIGEYLASRSSAQRRATAEVLEARSDVAESFIATLDEHAARSGVVPERREQTRVMYEEVLWRLRNQPADLVVDEYRTKLTKMEAFEGPLAGVRREQIARAGEKAFWDWNTGKSDPRTQQAIRALVDEGPAAGGEEPDDATEAGEGDANKPHPAARGAKMMGIGLIIFGVGAGLTAAGAYPMVFVATVGAVWFLIGLLTLIADSLASL